jgi:hypothetical protein
MAVIFMGRLKFENLQMAITNSALRSHALDGEIAGTRFHFQAKNSLTGSEFFPAGF